MTVSLARHALIAMAVILGPVWLVWVLGGMIADRRGQRALAVLKGLNKNAA